MNHIESIKIENFKCFNQVEVSDFAQINLFVGKNNSGKSCLLEGLFFLEGAKKPLNLVANQKLRNVKEPNDLKNLIYFYHNLNYKSPFILSGIMNGEKRIVTISLFSPTIKTINLNDLEDDLRTDQIDVSECSVSFTENGITTTGYLKEKTVKEVEADTSNVIYISSVMHKTDISELFKKVVDIKEKETIIRNIQKIDNNIIDIEIGTKGISLNLKNNDFLLPLSIYGEGMKKIITLLCELVSKENSVFCIDELENSFHFSTFKTLWVSILSIAKLKNHQLFISTHNEELIESLIEEVLQTEDFEDMQEKTAIYTIGRKGDAHKAYRYSYPQALAAIDNHFELRR